MKIGTSTDAYETNALHLIKRNAIQEYFDQRCVGEVNGREFWNTIRPFLTNKGTYGQNEIVLREQNEIITETAKVCNIFNEHFVNIAADIGPDQNNADYT